MSSPLEELRKIYAFPLAKELTHLDEVAFSPLSEGFSIPEEIQKLFPKTYQTKAFSLVSKQGKKRLLKVGAIFSGGPASGGHNVLAGLFDALQKIDAKSELLGFLGGPSGILENRHKRLTKQAIDGVRNLGGFDLLGSGRTKIEKREDLEKARLVVEALQLDGLVIIGGDDSNTNAALLAEYFLEKGSRASVVGIPKTIDGDLKTKDIEISFGFDSASKTYAEMVGNIARDARSSEKYYHFIRLMGRSASHLTLECALMTHPNLALISEEGKNLSTVVAEIVHLIEKRAERGKKYGVVLIPEGLIENMADMKVLLSEIALGFDEGKLSEASKRTFATLPRDIQEALKKERDPHGNLRVSQIPTEKLLIDLVKKELEKKGGGVQVQDHFLGYEGRAVYPSNFDAMYCYHLGFFAALAVRDHLTGVIGAVLGLKGEVSQWKMKAVPIVSLLHIEERSGKKKPVIAKALVDLKGKPFQEFMREKERWMLGDEYLYPGPIQFSGPKALTDAPPYSLRL